MDSEQSPAAGIDGVERFRPTSGRLTGAVLIVAGSVVAVLALIDPSEVAPVVGVTGVLAALLGWAAALRPRVSLVGDDLELRNMLDTVTIPVAAIEELAVRQVLAVRVGEKRFTSPAVGRRRKSLLKGGASVQSDTEAVTAKPDTEQSYAEFVEERIRQRMDDVRARTGVRRGSDEQQALAAGVRRAPAWPEIIGLGATLAALVVVIVL